MSNITLQEAKRIAKEAYIFGFPFVSNYRVFFTPLLEGKPLMQGADFNQFIHHRQLFPPETADTTQRDTVYSLGIIDLRREPMVISVPDVPEGQAYMLQMGDTSTEALPYISTITTDNKAGDYVLLGPDFQGYLPAQQIDGVITTRGQFVIMVGRTMAFDPDDLAPVHAIQDGMKMRLLSEFLGIAPPEDPAPVDFSPWDGEKAAGLGIFDYINMALVWHPPAIHEVEAMASFARIGVIPGQRFSTNGLSSELIAALEAGIVEAKSDIEQQVEQTGSRVGNWNWATEDVSRFGTNYLMRASISLKNIYPNAPDHAVYGQTARDLEGQPLSGEHSYSFTLEAGNLPPVNWFWSLTLYDAETTSMYPNALERYSISDRTKGLQTNDDGSLTVTIQHSEPDDKANWLPAPAGNIYLVLRLYGAKPEVLTGKWTPPPIKRVD
jgi:hypothetical protein